MPQTHRTFHSLLTFGVGARLAIATVAVAVVWALTGWAIA